MSAAGRRALEQLLRASGSPREGLEALLRASASSLEPGARERLAALPLEAEREPLAHWLVARLEEGFEPAPELRFRLALDTWHGRVDSADLELSAGGARAGSAVLARLARLAPWEAAAEELAPAELLALGYAALALARALERVDEDLALGPFEAREIELELPGRALLRLGRLTRAGWERSSAGLERVL